MGERNLSENGPLRLWAPPRPRPPRGGGGGVFLPPQQAGGGVY